MINDTTQNHQEKFFQTKEWDEAFLEYISADKKTQSQIEFIDFLSPDSKIFSIACSRFFFQSYQNINHLYTPLLDFRLQPNAAFAETDISSINIKNISLIRLYPFSEDFVHNLKLSNHFRISTFFYSLNWKANAQSQHHYWTKRPSALINTIKRKKKKISKLNYKFFIYKNINIDIINQYWDIFHSSWKPDEYSKSFITWLLTHSSKIGSLRLGISYIDNEPVAFQFWIIEDETAYIYKLAQKIKFNEFSPGTILMSEMIDYVFSHDNIKYLDFLTGADDYKKNWMDNATKLVGIEIFNTKSFFGLALWNIHLFKMLIKKIIFFGRS